MIGTATWFDLDDRGLTIEPERSPDFEDVGILFGEILRMGESYHWSLGDLYIYAEDRFGEQAAQLVNAAHIKPKTLQNIVYVCRRFPKPNRVRGLRFSHHAAAASLFGVSEHPEWEEAGWILLQDAAHQGLSEDDVSELSRQIRGIEPRGEAVSFEKRPIPARIEFLVKKTEGVIADLPEDWDAERELLEDALDSLARCATSAKARPDQEKRP